MVGEGLEGGAGAFEVLGVEVEGDEGAVGREYGGGVAGEAQSAVDDGLVGLGVEEAEDLVEEDGDVAGFSIRGSHLRSTTGKP